MPVSFLLTLVLASPVFPTPVEIEALSAKLIARRQTQLEKPCPTSLRSAAKSPRSVTKSGGQLFVEWLASPEISACNTAWKASEAAFDDEKRRAKVQAKAVALCAAALPSLERLDDAATGCKLGLPATLKLEAVAGTTKGLIAAVAQMAKDGQPDPALWHLLRLTRTGRLGAAHGSLLASIVGAFIQERALEAALEVSPGPDRANLLAALARQQADTPHPREVLLGEAAFVLLNNVAPGVVRDGWSAPGGWPDGQRPDPNMTPIEMLDVAVPNGSPRDRSALLWWAVEDYFGGLEAACPTSASVPGCVSALVKRTAKAPEVSKFAQLGALSLALSGDGAPLRRVVSKLTALLLGMNWGQMLNRAMRPRFLSAALAFKWAHPADERCGKPARSEYLVITKDSAGFKLSPKPWMDYEKTVKIRCKR